MDFTSLFGSFGGGGSGTSGGSGSPLGGSGMGEDISLSGSDALAAGLANPYTQTDQSLSLGGGAGRLSVGISPNQIISGLAVLLFLGLLAIGIKRKFF